MCGITGFIDYGNTIGKDTLIRASNALKHRGGSGSGYFIENKATYNVGFANERLATIFVSDLATQPFTSACGNYVITFNGTIYNHADLRTELTTQASNFKTISDTEVLLEAYKKWGKDLFKKIDGAFAFAILDRIKQQVFIARDALGVKPLYLYKLGKQLFFSSEIKGLLNYPIQKLVNVNALASYLRYGYFMGSETIYQNISNFKKQHYSIIDLTKETFFESKFEIKQVSLVEDCAEPEILKQLDKLITKSVLGRATTDVKKGVLLSGGYDSATVAAILQKNSSIPINTFTLGFKDKKFDEAPFAKKIAQHLNTNHVEFYIDDVEAVKSLEALPTIFDEPIGDSGAISLAFINQQINKEGIKVILGAEGGDELFAGYTNYVKATDLWRKSAKLPYIAKKIIPLVLKSRKHKLNEIFSANSLLESYQCLTSCFSNFEIKKLLTQDVSIENTSSNKDDSIRALLDFDLEHYLPNDLLFKSDRISMHYSIDNRDALLNTELVSFSKQLPTSLLTKNNQLKYLLKEVNHTYIPKILMDRPKKGFSIPITKWMSTIYKPIIETYLTQQELSKHKLLNTSEVIAIKNRFFANANNADAKKLWMLLQFQMWYNKAFN